MSMNIEKRHFIEIIQRNLFAIQYDLCYNKQDNLLIGDTYGHI